MAIRAYYENPNGRVVEAFLELEEEQTLFVQSNIYNSFPEIFAKDGCQYVVTTIVEEVLDSDSMKDLARSGQVKLALTKLEKGYIVDNTGNIHPPKTARGTFRELKKEFIYTNNGTKMHVLKGKNFGGVKGSTTFTTKGIDQIKALSEKGVRATSLKVLSKAGKIFAVFDMYNMAANADSGGKSAGSMPGVFGAIGMVLDMRCQEMESEINEYRVAEMNKAKGQGLSAVEAVVKRWKHYNEGIGGPNAELKEGEMDYHTMEITPETASKLLEGEFRTYDEMQNFNYESTGENNVVILYRQVGSKKYENNTFIIETFFIQ